MHVDTNAVLVRQFLGSDAQLVGIIEDGTKAEPDLYSPIRCVVIFLKVNDLLLQLLLHGALPQIRQTIAAVHYGFGQLSA